MPPLPGTVIVEASRARLTKIPKGPLTKAVGGKLIVDLRRSELRKYHALNDAVANDTRTRAYIARRNQGMGN